MGSGALTWTLAGEGHGEQIEAGVPQVALYGFATFYLACVLLNWAAYLRPGVKYKNP